MDVEPNKSDQAKTKTNKQQQNKTKIPGHRSAQTPKYGNTTGNSCSVAQQNFKDMTRKGIKRKKRRKCKAGQDTRRDNLQNKTGNNKMETQRTTRK